MQTPRTEFAQALKAITTERGLDADVIIETIKEAIIAAYRRDAKERGEEEVENIEFEATIDPVTGEAGVFSFDPEKPKKKTNVTPPGFGRIAAQTAKQVIRQKIREAEKSSIMDEFEGRVGSLISGLILRFDGPDVRIDLGRTEGIMPSTDRVPNERLSANQRLTFLLKEILETERGKRIILSRNSGEFVKKLFEREVPEISSGSVEVKMIARDPGVRTKMVVESNQSGVDPVGSCVGQKGIRVQAVTNDLGGERVDIIPWNKDTKELIKTALAPAEGVAVVMDEDKKTAKITVPEDQLSLAIGKDGQNARLAAKLTGWRIEIEGDGVKIEGEKVTEEQSDKVTKKGKKTKKETETEEEKTIKEGKKKTKKKIKKTKKTKKETEEKGEKVTEEQSVKVTKKGKKTKKETEEKGEKVTEEQSDKVTKKGKKTKKETGTGTEEEGKETKESVKSDEDK